MTRNLKALGLALVAMFAMSALAASAQAEENTLTVTPEFYPTALTVDSISNFIIKTNAGTEVTCSVVEGHATIEEPGASDPVGDTDVTLTDVNFTSCDTSTGQKITIDMQNCDYILHGGEETESEPDHFAQGTIDLFCPEGVTGPKVTIWANAAKHTSEPNNPLCTLTLWRFFNRGEITYKNTATTTGPPHIPNDFDLRIVNLETNYTRTGSILCGTTPNSAKDNGELTITGFEDFGVNGSGTPIEGDRIGVTISDGITD